MTITSPDIVGFSSERLLRINSVMQKYVDDGQLAGMSTKVARRGQTVHLEKFGLMDVGATGQAGSVGEFGWDGAFNTYVFIDPAQELYGLLMTQHLPNNYYPVASKFKQLVYQSIVA